MGGTAPGVRATLHLPPSPPPPPLRPARVCSGSFGSDVGWLVGGYVCAAFRFTPFEARPDPGEAVLLGVVRSRMNPYGYISPNMCLPRYIVSECHYSRYSGSMYEQFVVSVRARDSLPTSTGLARASASVRSHRMYLQLVARKPIIGRDRRDGKVRERPLPAIPISSVREEAPGFFGVSQECSEAGGRPIRI